MAAVMIQFEMSRAAEYRLRTNTKVWEQERREVLAAALSEWKEPELDPSGREACRILLQHLART